MTLQYLHLLVIGGITHVNLHHETVELGLGQAISAFLFHRVLSGKHSVKWRHVTCHAINSALTLFHHLKQCRLCLGWSTVYLVDKNNLRENWALVKLKLLSLDVKHVSSQNITRHKVGGELNPLEIGINEL